MAENGWGEYENLVLDRIESLGKDVKELFGKIDTIRVQNMQDVERVKGEIKLLHFKAGIIGLIGGSIPACIWLMFKAFN